MLLAHKSKAVLATWPASIRKMKNQYPGWLRKAARKGGKAKSAAKTAAARKANAARWCGHKPKRVTATPNGELKHAEPSGVDCK